MPEKKLSRPNFPAQLRTMNNGISAKKHLVIEHLRHTYRKQTSVRILEVRMILKKTSQKSHMELLPLGGLL